MEKIFRRKEVKYLLTAEQRKCFIEAISGNISKDKFDKYTICNVYYDTPDAMLIRRSIEKPVYKEKMRIRSYGIASDSTNVFIELKKKYKGIVYKRRIAMPLKEATTYIAGESIRTGQIEEEIDYFLGLYEGISPAMFISYNRQAYSAVENPDIRITFDDNILWRDKDVSLSSEIYGNPILENNKSIMEIKCVGAMPLWIVKALSENRIFKTSFSKYGKAYLSNIA